MAAPLGEKTRGALVWGGLLALVVVGFVVTIGILNATVYSAGGFVRGYVDALDRGDTTSALGLAGVQATGAEGDVLLTVPEKGLLDDVHQISDAAAADGTHRVEIGFTSDGVGHTTRFAVRRTGTIAGLFGRWEFSSPPTASVDVTPEHDNRFWANGSEIVSKSADLATRYTVLAPAVFDLSHDSMYLTARTTRVVAATVGGVATGSVDVEPKAAFVDKVRADVDRYLRTTCLPQKVLLPSGCPFGEEINDRITSAPHWSMASYPAVRLTPTSTLDQWRVVTAPGRAHLLVKAESLYDGHDYTIDEDVPFTVGYLVSIGSNNGLTITPQ